MNVWDWKLVATIIVLAIYSGIMLFACALGRAAQIGDRQLERMHNPLTHDTDTGLDL